MEFNSFVLRFGMDVLLAEDCAELLVATGLNGNGPSDTGFLRIGLAGIAVEGILIKIRAGSLTDRNAKFPSLIVVAVKGNMLLGEMEFVGTTFGFRVIILKIRSSKSVRIPTTHSSPLCCRFSAS